MVVVVVAAAVEVEKNPVSTGMVATATVAGKAAVVEATADVAFVV